MDRAYSIWIVSPPGYVHSRCFEEVALALHQAFAELGYDAPIVTDAANTTGQAIALGVNLLRPGVAIPPNCILYNLEQMSGDSTWVTPFYVELLRRYRVWDYSSQNIAALAQLGVRANLCEIGYAPALTRIETAPEHDIDIAFVGSINERRRNILDALQTQGKNVAARFNLYGLERDAIFARAKIVLNIHFYAAKVFEIVRCSYLLANRICVVSETGAEPAVEQRYSQGVAFAPYEELVDLSLQLLDDEKARRTIAEAGFEAFSAQSQAHFLKAALNASGGA